MAGAIGRFFHGTFNYHMGDCDYFEYNGREFCITGHVSHILFFPLHTRNALMRMPVNVFGVFGGIDVSHVPGAKERCILWARRRAFTIWAAILCLLFGLLLLTGVFGAGAIVGCVLMVPGVLSTAAAASVYFTKPRAPEACVGEYKALLKPLFPESDLPNLEPTALEAVTAILSGKELHNDLGKALQEEKVNPSEVMDSCLLLHPCIAAGNHGSTPPSEVPPADLENSGHSRRPLLEGKVEASGETEATSAADDENEHRGAPNVVQISPLARMLESIPEPCEVRNQPVENPPPGNAEQFCVMADEQENLSEEQWRSVASTLNKFLGPKATVLGRAVLPPENVSRNERGTDSLFLENTPVHDDSHVVYIETPSSKKSQKGSRRLEEVNKFVGRLVGKVK